MGVVQDVADHRFAESGALEESGARSVDVQGEEHGIAGQGQQRNEESARMRSERERLGRRLPGQVEAVRAPLGDGSGGEARPVEGAERPVRRHCCEVAATL